MTRLSDSITRLTGGAVLPADRNHTSFSAWWVAFLGALGVLLSLVLIFPDPYLELLKTLPDGLLATFEITLFATLLALLLGLVTAFGWTSRNPIVNAVASIYVVVVHGIPLLVQLFFLFYALGRFASVSNITAAVIAIAFCYGAVMGEAFRAGIEAVDKGQTEVARSLGFNPAQTMIHVILPQAWRTILPAIAGKGVALFKDTSLVSILAVADLLGRGREFAAESQTYFETYAMIALLYLLITLVLSRLAGIMEARLKQHVRP